LRWPIRPIWIGSTILPALCARALVPYVATAGAIDVVLRKGDATQRVLQEAASGFRISLVRETEQGEEVLDLDRLATDSDMSPIIKLVDTIIFNAMESRASDIHIETRDTEVQVKYRIDGALYQKVDPIDLAFHQTLISRIKVMSELDIAERRVPQDWTFSCSLQRSQRRLPRFDHADRARRRRGHSYPR
jgi:type IV pilus assembly protein PilB